MAEEKTPWFLANDEEEAEEDTPHFNAEEMEFEAFMFDPGANAFGAQEEKTNAVVTAVADVSMPDVAPFALSDMPRTKSGPLLRNTGPMLRKSGPLGAPPTTGGLQSSPLSAGSRNSKPLIEGRTSSGPLNASMVSSPPLTSTDPALAGSVVSRSTNPFGLDGERRASGPLGWPDEEPTDPANMMISPRRRKSGPLLRQSGPLSTSSSGPLSEDDLEEAAVAPSMQMPTEEAPAPAMAMPSIQREVEEAPAPGGWSDKALASVEDFSAVLVAMSGTAGMTGATATAATPPPPSWQPHSPITKRGTLTDENLRLEDHGTGASAEPEAMMAGPHADGEANMQVEAAAELQPLMQLPANKEGAPEATQAQEDGLQFEPFMFDQNAPAQGGSGPLPFWLRNTGDLEATPVTNYMNMIGVTPGEAATESAGDLDAEMLDDLPEIAPFDFSDIEEPVSEDEELGFSAGELSGFSMPARNTITATTDLEAVAHMLEGEHEGLDLSVMLSQQTIQQPPQTEHAQAPVDAPEPMEPMQEQPATQPEEAPQVTAQAPAAPVEEQQPEPVTMEMPEPAEMTSVTEPAEMEMAQPAQEEVEPMMQAPEMEAPGIELEAPEQPVEMLNPLTFAEDYVEEEEEPEPAPTMGAQPEAPQQPAEVEQTGYGDGPVSTGGWTTMVTGSLSPNAPEQPGVTADMATGSMSEADLSLEDLGISPFSYTELNLENEEVPTEHLTSSQLGMITRSRISGPLGNPEGRTTGPMLSKPYSTGPLGTPEAAQEADPNRRWSTSWLGDGGKEATETPAEAIGARNPEEAERLRRQAKEIRRMSDPFSAETMDLTHGTDLPTEGLELKTEDFTQDEEAGDYPAHDLRMESVEPLGEVLSYPGRSDITGELGYTQMEPDTWNMPDGGSAAQQAQHEQPEFRGAHIEMTSQPENVVHKAQVQPDTGDLPVINFPTANLQSGPLPELEGFDHLRQYVLTHTDDLGAYMALASAYAQMGDLATELRVYRRVLRKPHVSTNLIRLIAEELSDCESEMSGQPQFHQVRGDLYMRQGRFQEAISEYNKIM
jgi:hypothetical protein